MRQSVDIAKHLGKGLMPGVGGNIWRFWLAATDQKRSTGQPYSMQDETLALLGFRSSTFDPTISLYYRTFDFTQQVSEARGELSSIVRNPNRVSDADIKSAWRMANRKQGRAFEQMRRLVESAEAAGMSRREIAQSLRLSGISQQNINHLLRGSIPKVDLSTNAYRRAESRARVLMGGDAAREVRERYMRTQTLRE